MKTFEEFLEAKQVGTLYHFTTKEGLLHILSKQDFDVGICDIFGFISYNDHISTSRDFMLLNDPAGHFTVRTHNVRIAFDGDKLSNKYKIKPINGLTTNQTDIFGIDKNQYRVPSKSEKEEVICPVKNSKIFNLKDYVLEIYIYSHSKDDIDFSNKVESIIKKENLNINVVLGRKWKPFNENYNRDGNFTIEEK